MTTQNLPAPLGSADREVAFEIVRDDYKAAILTTFAAAGTPSDERVQRLLHDINRQPGDPKRVKVPDHLAMIHLCAQRDGARPVDITAIARKALAFFGEPDVAPPPSHLRLVSVEETKAESALNVLQAELTDNPSESVCYAIEEYCETQIAALRKLQRCATATRVQRAQFRAVAKQRVGIGRAS